LNVNCSPTNVNPSPMDPKNTIQAKIPNS
jgi:hypothetical protein